MTKALQTMEWMTPGSNLNAYIQGAAAIPILSVDEEKLDKKNLVLLKELLEKFPGLSSVELEVNSKTGSKLLELKEIRVKKTNQLKNEISTLLAK